VPEILIPRLLFLLKVLFCAQGLGLHRLRFDFIVHFFQG
jgi:hypothetical protein